jgi:hypothetical protein
LGCRLRAFWFRVWGLGVGVRGVEFLDSGFGSRLQGTLLRVLV